MAFDPATLATLYVADYDGNTVRVVPGAGRTVPSTATLALAGGAAQGVLVDQVAPVPLSVTLADGGGSLLAGYRVEFAPVTVGAAVSPARAPTSGAGVALTSMQVGLAPQAYRFSARYDDIHGRPVAGSPVLVDVQAAAPADGTGFVAVNGSRVAGSAGTGGPGVLAHVSAPMGVAMASDGTVYFSDSANDVVKALSPLGILTVVAGTGTCGLSGDGGLATAAALCTPKGLALDASGPGRLYVADAGNARVRVVNLGTGVISAVAGGGTATAAPWGDPGPATQGVLSNPGHVRLNGGRLYIADVGHNLVRVVDLTLATPTISTFLARPATSCPTTGTLPTDVIFWACQSDQGCDVAFDGAGRTYVSGQFCGGVLMGSYYFHGIVRTADGGATLEHVAGIASTPPASDGSAATATPLAAAASITVGPDGRLYYVVAAEAAVRALDHLDNLALSTVSTVAGTTPAPAPSPGNGADYVPAGSLRLSAPWDFVIQPGGGHRAISDTGNDAVRLVW